MSDASQYDTDIVDQLVDLASVYGSTYTADELTTRAGDSASLRPNLDHTDYILLVRTTAQTIPEHSRQEFQLAAIRLGSRLPRKESRRVTWENVSAPVPFACMIAAVLFTGVAASLTSQVRAATLPAAKREYCAPHGCIEFYPEA